MMLSPSTKNLVSEIGSSSGKTLHRAMDLGVLIEIAEKNSMQDALNDLAFSAKFIVKSFDLMQRIGKEGDGYEKIAHEFSEQIKKSQAALTLLLEKSDAMTRSHFGSQYLEMNTLTMQNLMQLYHDLGHYKNYLIDHRPQ